MGFSTTINKDYYIKFKPQTITITEEHKFCETCIMKKTDRSEKFCKDCGTPITIRKISKTNTISDLDTLMDREEFQFEEFEDLVYSPEFGPKGFAVINLSTGAGQHNIDEDEEFLINFNNPKEIAIPEFSDSETKEYIDKFIEVFKHVYGEDSISLEYGIFSYTS